MRSEVESKRSKFAKQIRMKQHQQYFDMYRQSNAPQLPALAYIPIMLDNQLYEDIEIILDSIESTWQPQQLNTNMLSIIKQRYQHHSDIKIQILMFKLLNRLGQWGERDVQQALRLIEQGNQEMVKELAVYLQCKLNKLQTLPEKQQKNAQQPLQNQILKIFKATLPIKLTNLQNRIFWLDIICKTIQNIPSALTECTSNIDAFMFAIDVGISNSNQFQLIRVFKIITQLSSIPDCQIRIVQLDCFPTVLGMIMDGSIEVVLEGLEILAELMSIDDAIVHKMVHQFGIVKIFNKYIDHIMIAVQARVLWGISNIAGSQNYKILLNDKKILDSLINKSKNETRPEIRIESHCCLLNIICNCSQSELQYLYQTCNITELVMHALEQSHQKNIKNMLFQRLLYSIFHMIHDYGKSFVLFDQMGLRRVLTGFYQQEKEEGKLKMLGELLDLVDKRSKEEAH